MRKMAEALWETMEREAGRIIQNYELDYRQSDPMNVPRHLAGDEDRTAAEVRASYEGGDQAPWDLSDEMWSSVYPGAPFERQDLEPTPSSRQLGELYDLQDMVAKCDAMIRRLDHHYPAEFVDMEYTKYLIKKVQEILRLKHGNIPNPIPNSGPLSGQVPAWGEGRTDPPATGYAGTDQPGLASGESATGPDYGRPCNLSRKPTRAIEL
jgi:hypothetical protein